MKLRNIHIPFTIVILLLFSCKEETKKIVVSSVDKPKEVILKDTITIKDNEIYPNIEFNLQKLPAQDSLGNFTLHKPDTLRLKQLEKQREWSESIAYLYLVNYYNKTSSKDSVEYIELDLKKKICSFNQSFDGGIKYYIWECKEDGGWIEEKIEFPKIELKKAKEFIEILFYDKSNNWRSDFEYEADGAGCYYKIIQKENKTRIDVFCGC